MSFLIADFAYDFRGLKYERKFQNHLPKVQYLVKCKQSSFKNQNKKTSKIERHVLKITLERHQIIFKK